MTEHHTGEGKLYLCAIKDVFSNRIVGYSIDSRMKSRLATTALANAVARRGEVAGCVVHSDRGSQFRSRKFVRALGYHDMVGSMGRVGAAGDNAAMESFFSLLQKYRPGPPPLGYPRAVAHRHRHLDRADLSPAPPAGRPGPVDPHRIRSNHDHTGQSGRVTQTVT
ncbi:hypothetical protein MFAL_34390 [Mycolicibacterium fallax]|nr:hypothetical protein MFAL_34390 [Mycolicibacterium fallax]